MRTEREYSVAYYTDAGYTGGAEKYIFYLASRIGDEGFRPTVLFDEKASAEKLRSWLSSSDIPCDEIKRGRGAAGRLGCGSRPYACASGPRCSSISSPRRLRRAKCMPHRMAPTAAMAAKMPSS